ncbi:MAG: EamA family transporter [Candidatus Promineifilaceae bacterium]|nr:EamA family transporter [Candidatus Promineifilaceae bacterium]
MSSSQLRPSATWPWVAAALAAHTGWGAYPVLARYLQTVSQLPSMALLAGGNLVALVALVMLVRPRLSRRFLRSRLLWIFVLIIVTRSVTNLLAARFTLAIYVQLLTLMTPFLVAVLNGILFRDHMPRYTGRAILLALIGALLMMSGNIQAESAQLTLGRNDWLGIGLALLSSLSLALYMLLIRHSAQRNIAGENMFLIQLLAVSAVTLSLSLGLQDDWTSWRSLQLRDWLIFAAFSLGVLFGANTGQIAALRRLGAPMVSTLLAWRLVSALIVAALLLDERLRTPAQAIGAIIVLVTITWYLWQQSHAQQAPPFGPTAD